MTLSDEIKALVSTLEMQLNGFARAAYEKDLRIADLERQLAEASAPVEFPADGRNDDPAEAAFWRFDARKKGYNRWKGAPQSERDAFKAEYRAASAAPQAADTDKVREALTTEQMAVIRYGAELLRQDGYTQQSADMYAVLASMAAQAPVREVPGWQPIETAPKDGREILVRYPKQGNVKQIGNFNTIHKHWESKGARMWAVEQQCEWHPLPADLPAAPVQQEGASNA